MQILEALAKLDPSADVHWTLDGAPRMDVMQKLVGSAELTRADVTNAAPSFSRENAGDYFGAQSTEDTNVETHPETEEGSEATGEVEADEVPISRELEEEADPTEPDPEPEEAEVMVEAAPLPNDPTDPVPGPSAPVEPPEMEALQEELAAATKVMVTAQQAQEEAKKQADYMADVVNAINRKIDLLTRTDPNHATAGIRAYLKRQHEVRMARAAGMQRFLKTTGLHPADVAKATDPKAPIDRAMAMRKPPRGTARPMYPVQKIT